jgi:hypothetical protein
MGGAESICIQKRVGTGEVRLGCSSGTLHIEKSLQIGMMAKDTKAMIHCTEASIWKNEEKTLTNCTSTLNRDLFIKRIYDKCHQKEKCTVDIKGLQNTVSD